MRGGRRGRSAPRGRRPPPAGCGTEQTPRRCPRPELHGRHSPAARPPLRGGRCCGDAPAHAQGPQGAAASGAGSAWARAPPLAEPCPLSQAPAPLTRAPPLRATGSRPVALVATVTSEPAGPRARPTVTAQGPSPRGARGQAPAPLGRPRSGAPGGLPTPEEGTGNRRGLRGDLQRRRRRSHGSDAGRRRGEETRRSAFQAQAAHKGQRRLSERRPGPRDVTPGHRLLAQTRISPGRGRLRAPPALAGVSAPEAPVPETREGCPRAGGTQASSGTRTRASDVPQQHEEKDGCRGPAGGMRSKAAVRVCVWVCLCECTCVVCVHM